MYTRNLLLLLLFAASTRLQAQTVVFFDDFESGLANWSVTGMWNTTTEYAFSPSNCLTDSPDGDYLDMFSSEATMVVDADLSTALDADIQFQAIVDLETAFDYVYIDASADGGDTWTLVYTMNGEDMWDWTLYTIPIGAFVGSPTVRVRFRFVSDAAYFVDGLYIDDFSINKYNLDVSPPLILHTAPYLYEGVLGENTLSAEIIDASGISSTTLYYNVDGGAYMPISGTWIGGDVYSFTIPEYAPGTFINYYIEAVDDFGIPNTAVSPNYDFIAGNYMLYDDPTIDFVADIGTLAMTGYGFAAVKFTLTGETDIVTAIIQNYTDYMRPNDDIRFHVWADDGGYPGADLITPFYVTPEPTLLEPNRGTRIDLRGFPELEGITGDVFIGYDVPGGVAWLSYASTGVVNRSYVKSGFGWAEFFGDMHFRIVTTEITGAPEALYTYSAVGEPTISFTDLSTNAPTSWFWDFGDGATATIANPEHTFTTNGVFNVCLTATNGVGSDTYCELINIDSYALPAAAFSYTGDPVVTFTDLTANAPTEWFWDFADGSTSTEQNPVHEFTTDGVYYVCLTAGNVIGENTYCELIEIDNTPETPVVDFTWSIAGTLVTFTDISTNVPTYWDWDFGDGASSTEQNPDHFYPAPTSYTVCLTAGNAAGEATTCRVLNFNGVEMTASFPLTIAPNPTASLLQLDFNEVTPTFAQIFDLHGKLLYETQVPSTHILDVSQLPAGNYILRLQSDNAVVHTPFVKQ